jgi:hypothetical protein
MGRLRMNMMSKIGKIVSSTLKTMFPEIEIVRVNVAEHRDDEGDAILEITVVFGANDRDFDSARLKELPRLIMPKLREVKEDGFPMFSFVSESDLGKMKPEAA